MAKNKEKKAEPKAKKVEAKKAEYVVAKGCSITSLRGVLKEGQEVKASYFRRGEEVIKQHLGKVIVKG